MDGKECAYTGPTELPAGEYEILINNTSEIATDIHIARMLDGHTYQEVLEMQPEPGAYFDMDFSWFEGSMRNLAGWDENDNYIYRFSLNKEGEYAIGFLPAEGFWFCGSIMVYAAPAE